jgi:hypothetical protein
MPRRLFSWRPVKSWACGVAVIGIDIGKNSFHVIGLDDRGAIVLRQKWSRGQIGHQCRRLRGPKSFCKPIRDPKQTSIRLSALHLRR